MMVVVMNWMSKLDRIVSADVRRDPGRCSVNVAIISETLCAPDSRGDDCFNSRIPASSCAGSEFGPVLLYLRYRESRVVICSFCDNPEGPSR